jgi:hypothetical protein
MNNSTFCEKGWARTPNFQKSSVCDILKIELDVFQLALSLLSMLLTILSLFKQKTLSRTAAPLVNLLEYISFVLNGRDHWTTIILFWISSFAFSFLFVEEIGLKFITLCVSIAGVVLVIIRENGDAEFNSVVHLSMFTTVWILILLLQIWRRPLNFILPIVCLLILITMIIFTSNNFLLVAEFLLAMFKTFLIVFVNFF